MHGTVTNCAEFCSIASRYGALSCIDDAHGFGVSRSSEKERFASCDCVITTLSKTLGTQGGAVLGSKVFIEYLVNFASGFIYTTSLSPAIVGGALAALRLLPSLDKERQFLWKLISLWTHKMEEAGQKGGGESSQIQPIYVGSSDRALALQRRFKEKQIHALAVRPPTVPPNGALVRFLLTTGHSEESLEMLFQRVAIRERAEPGEGGEPLGPKSA